MTRHYWTKEEESLISSLIGYHPVKRIVTLFKVHFPLDISDLAIKAKVEKVARLNKELIRDRVDNYSMSAVGRFLGVNNIIVNRWMKSGLRARKCGGLWIIKHRDIVEFAKANPKRFRQCSKAGLEWLFEGDNHWIKLILGSNPLKPVRPVLCVTTGKVYPSLTSASVDLKVSRYRIKAYIDSGLPTKIGDKYFAFRWAD